ncbi:unnamed protein product [Menidia menidia]|uniref:Protein Spindly n=1 Tax=Menidia menidia TaxID=238744 RepID=A0A8S4BGD2_9TELE|nr:unnamed protein product [Menidia menidia]
MAAEEEIQLLRSQLKEKEKQVHQAAQAGLDLLNQQVELQSRLDDQRVEMTNALEALEQEKYSLQKEVELKNRMLESLQSEYECFKKQLKQQLQEQQEHLEMNHSLAVNELHNKALRLQSALEESQLNEKQLKHKLEAQTETLHNKTEELRALNEQTHSSMTSEMMEVQMRVVELENTRVEMEQALQESQYKEQQLQLNTSSLQRHLERITEEKEEREKEAVSWFNALEKSRELNRDLQIQLDQVLQEAQDPNSKGNSLFAELEDKRAEMEKQLISVKVQYHSLQKIHAFSKQQMQRMKMLLKSQPAKPGPAEGGDSQDETYYTDLLKMQLGNAVKDAVRLGDELSLQRMKSLSEKAKKDSAPRKRKEKLPADPTPSANEPAPGGGQQTPAAVEVIPPASEAPAGPTAEAPGPAPGPEPEPEPRPSKCVKISVDEPAVIPDPSAPAEPREEESEENQQQNKREDRKRKQRTVEMIHVSSHNSMETQCAQQ